MVNHYHVWSVILACMIMLVINPELQAMSAEKESFEFTKSATQYTIGALKIENMQMFYLCVITHSEVRNS